MLVHHEHHLSVVDDAARHVKDSRRRCVTRPQRITHHDRSSVPRGTGAAEGVVFGSVDIVPLRKRTLAVVVAIGIALSIALDSVCPPLTRVGVVPLTVAITAVEQCLSISKLDVLRVKRKTKVDSTVVFISQSTIVVIAIAIVLFLPLSGHVSVDAHSTIICLATDGTRENVVAGDIVVAIGVYAINASLTERTIEHEQVKLINQPLCLLLGAGVLVGRHCAATLADALHRYRWRLYCSLTAHLFLFLCCGQYVIAEPFAFLCLYVARACIFLSRLVSLFFSFRSSVLLTRAVGRGGRPLLLLP
jgi:hypothetical protein